MLRSKTSRFDNLVGNLKSYLEGVYPQYEATLNSRKSELGFQKFAFANRCHVASRRRNIDFYSDGSKRIKEYITLETEYLIIIEDDSNSSLLMSEVRNWLDDAFHCWLQSLGFFNLEEEFKVIEDIDDREKSPNLPCTTVKIYRSFHLIYII
jgi:hypothetical protein